MKETISGAFYTVGLYLAYSNWIIPALISILGATAILKISSRDA